MATLTLLRSRPRAHHAVRHPARTQERILAAALREFSEKGFAGARVDRIARRARVNKRMLYHYFGNKESLFREILARKVRERAAWAVTAPDDAAESLAFWLTRRPGSRRRHRAPSPPTRRARAPCGRGSRGRGSPCCRSSGRASAC